MIKRAGAVLGCLIVAVHCGLSGCGVVNATETVSVLASWTGDEQAAFERVLDGFTAKTGIRYTYQGTRAINQVLRGDVQQGKPPDVAVLSNPGELAGYLRGGDLKPLDSAVTDADAAYSPQWLQLLRLGDKRLFAVPVKADLKSIIWYDPQRFGQAVPGTWDDLVATSQSLAAQGKKPWCLGMGAPPNSGFPGTDWIEDIVLHRSGTRAYHDWTAGRTPWTSPEIREAWQEWGKLVTSPGAVRGGPTAALLTSFGDAGKAMFGDPRGCSFDHLGSFAMGGYEGIRLPAGPPVPGKDFAYFGFPAFSGQEQAKPSEVSADLAGMFTETPAAKSLVSYLASAEGQRIWPSAGSTFSVHRQLTGEHVYRDGVSEEIARTLAQGTELCFDASDLMPSAMTGAFYRAVLEYLAHPDRLDSLLTQLEQVRQGIPAAEWLDLPCGPN